MQLIGPDLEYADLDSAAVALSSIVGPNPDSEPRLGNTAPVTRLAGIRYFAALPQPLTTGEDQCRTTALADNRKRALLARA